MCRKIETRQSGLTLIELILFIVIVGVGLAGILVTYDTVVRRSADPMVRKQALAIAESLLLEIEQQPFTWCDPQDANVTTATSAVDCAGGTASEESRGDNLNPFDNVADYANYGVLDEVSASDILGTALPELAGYQVQVIITQAGGTGAFAALPADAALRIAVTVTGRGGTVTLVGFRTRYAPNAAG